MTKQKSKYYPVTFYREDFKLMSDGSSPWDSLLDAAGITGDDRIYVNVITVWVDKAVTEVE